MWVAFVMSCSFTNHVLAELYVLENRKPTEQRCKPLAEGARWKVAKMHVLAFVAKLTAKSSCLRTPKFGARNLELMSTEIQECIAATDIAKAGIATVFA